MKTAIIAALIAAIAIGGALGAFAATRTVETAVGVDARVWQRVSDGEIYVSVRPEGGDDDAWVTSDALDMTDLSRTGRFHLSNLVTIHVPVTVVVDVLNAVPQPTSEPQVEGEAVPATEAGPCCEVEGMPGATDQRREIQVAMKRVIDFALEHYGITHSGTITLNIAFSDTGLLLRYEDAFGEELDELPDTCSFQRGEHMFFTSRCRSDETAIATEWIRRALGAGQVTPRWIGHGVFDYFVTHYTDGEVPTLTDDRFRRALFYERGAELRRDDASDDMMTLGMLYAIDQYGDFGDWMRFYGSTLAGLEPEVAFESVFNETLDDFYEDFEGWTDQQKFILISVAFPSCREAAQSLDGIQGSVGVGVGYPDYRVPLEPDEDGDGIVCENFVASPNLLPQQ